jgi:hypothetical protein
MLCGRSRDLDSFARESERRDKSSVGCLSGRQEDTPVVIAGVGGSGTRGLRNLYSARLLHGPEIEPSSRRQLPFSFHE